MKNFKKYNKIGNLSSNFNYKDPFLLDEQLTEEEILIRDTTRNFAQSKLQPQILKANRNEEYDSELFKKLGEIGLLGAQLTRLWLFRSFLNIIWPYC